MDYELIFSDISLPLKNYIEGFSDLGIQQKFVILDDMLSI
jgi:hypothetical protein